MLASSSAIFTWELVMEIDLAAFRLNALASLSASRSSSGRKPGDGGTDFMTALLNARNPVGAVAGAPAGLDALLGTESTRAADLLAQLEASNASFLKTYQNRVDQIGDEAQVLSRLRERVAALGQTSEGLTALSLAHSDDEVVAGLQRFVQAYNAWDSEFDPYFESGALLDENQAGEVARFSLKREVGSMFHGAGNGGLGNGLTDMGVSFTADGQLVLDDAAFGMALQTQRERALATVHNVARAFSEAAQLLASEGHLLDRRIDNGERAVAWAAANQARLEAEFGPGAVLAAQLQPGNPLKQ